MGAWSSSSTPVTMGNPSAENVVGRGSAIVEEEAGRLEESVQETMINNESTGGNVT